VNIRARAVEERLAGIERLDGFCDRAFPVGRLFLKEGAVVGCVSFFAIRNDLRDGQKRIAPARKK